MRNLPSRTVICRENGILLGVSPPRSPNLPAFPSIARLVFLVAVRYNLPTKLRKGSSSVWVLILNTRTLVDLFEPMHARPRL